ncbi:glycosyltransferase family 2 protein [Nostocoides sp.]|uniref:glycosyltransferase family 2 protein n=1 Tax=Nostocoides sp. TaxID=1917966 RepID=UPI002D094D98|nr:glycosyltransferase family 2 protein [Tetrasphaera sp.]
MAIHEATPEAHTWPLVSVIVPVLNEERHLADAVAMIAGQDYPGELEIVLALGPSSDGTDAVAAALAQADSRIRLVANPSGKTPAGLNAAIGASRGSIIARVDGHAEIPVDYVRVAVTALREHNAANVGGVMSAQGRTPFERAVATAMRSTIGVGNAAFHVGGQAAEAETVYLGVFRRDVLLDVGGFDEHYERAQDWEMNHRIRDRGGIIWFTPDLVVTYRPRSTPAALAKQYFQYGRWRHVIARHHEGSINLRYLAPPAMVLGTTAMGLLGLLWRPAWLVPAAYAGAVAVGGTLAGRGEPASVRALTPVALIVMHWSWGLGYLTSPPSLAQGRIADPRTGGSL